MRNHPQMGEDLRRFHFWKSAIICVICGRILGGALSLSMCLCAGCASGNTPHDDIPGVEMSWAEWARSNEPALYQRYLEYVRANQ